MTDTSQMTVAELLDYADQHPDEVEALLEDEEAGPNRTTAIHGLEARLTTTEEPVSDEPEVTEEETDEDAEEEPEGEEGVDWYRNADGVVLRLDDSSDEYRQELADQGLI